MSMSDDYRWLASECAAMAQRAADMRPRAVLLHMAEVWTKLANQNDAIDEQRQQIQPKLPDHEGE
jgi:hypothetical protein